MLVKARKKKIEWIGKNSQPMNFDKFIGGGDALKFLTFYFKLPKIIINLAFNTLSSLFIKSG